VRELVYYVAASLDGYIAGPDGQFDAFPVTGDHIAFQAAAYADTLPTAAAEHLGVPQTRSRFATVLMGWNTYAVGLDQGVDSPYRHLEQIVFSRRRTGTAENLVVTDRDPVATVRELKEQPGADIWLCGGGELAAQLVGEIDRLVVKRNPLLLGDGIPLFGRTAYAPVALDLVASRTFESGVVVSEHVRRR
jgi:dihydrofolate reductase